MADMSVYKEHAHTAFIYLAPIGCLLLLGFILNATNPLQTGPVSILLVFVMVYLFVFTTLAAILHMIGSVLHALKPQRVGSLRTGYYVLSVVSLVPVLMVALNTLGQLGALEFILILLLVGLGCFYVLRRSAK